MMYSGSSPTVSTSEIYNRTPKKILFDLIDQDFYRISYIAIVYVTAPAVLKPCNIPTKEK